MHSSHSSSGNDVGFDLDVQPGDVLGFVFGILDIATSPRNPPQPVATPQDDDGEMFLFEEA